MELCNSEQFWNVSWPYHVPVGEVELPWVFEDEVLTLFPFWILVFQINPEAFDVLDSCRNTDKFQLPVHRQTSHRSRRVCFARILITPCYVPHTKWPMSALSAIIWVWICHCTFPLSSQRLFLHRFVLLHSSIHFILIHSFHSLTGTRCPVLFSTSVSPVLPPDFFSIFLTPSLHFFSPSFISISPSLRSAFTFLSSDFPLPHFLLALHCFLFCPPSSILVPSPLILPLPVSLFPPSFFSALFENTTLL